MRRKGGGDAMRCAHERHENSGKATKWNARFMSFSRCFIERTGQFFGFFKMTGHSYTPEL